MLRKTVACLLIIVFIFSFIMSLHSDLTEMMMVEKLCVSDFNWTFCHQKADLQALFSLEEVSEHAEKWSRIFTVSTIVPSVITIIILSSVAEALVKKEHLGLYVAGILATQSLVYLTVSVFKSAKVEHFLAGALLKTLFGDLQGAVLLAWIFGTAVTDNNLGRSLLFVSIEGTTHVGKAAGHFTARYLPGFFPSISYLFAGTFILALLAYLLVMFVLPAFEDIIVWKHGLSAKNYYLGGKQGILSSLMPPIFGTKNEYLAGIILSGFLSQLGNSFFGSVISQYLCDPPVSLSFDASRLYLWSMTAFQGFSCILTGFALIRILFSSDTTMVLLSLSCAAFWMVLISYTSSLVMLYTLTFALAGFVPLAAALLRCIATKEDGILYGRCILLLGLFGSMDLACRAILTYNSHIFIDANRKIYHAFTLILAGVIQLLAFIVVASISCTFSKNLVEMPLPYEKTTKGVAEKLSTESEPLLEE